MLFVVFRCLSSNLPLSLVVGGSRQAFVVGCCETQSSGRCSLVTIYSITHTHTTQGQRCSIDDEGDEMMGAPSSLAVVGCVDNKISRGNV
jgi:hypothetical protein